jgi:hypothetical protein
MSRLLTGSSVILRLKTWDEHTTYRIWVSQLPRIWHAGDDEHQQAENGHDSQHRLEKSLQSSNLPHIVNEFIIAELLIDTDYYLKVLFSLVISFAAHCGRNYGGM